MVNVNEPHRQAADLRAGDVFPGHGTSFGRHVEAAGDAEPVSDGRVRVPLVIDEFNTDPDIYFPAQHHVRLWNLFRPDSA